MKLLLFALAAILGLTAVNASPEIAVSIRYLQPKGTSHAQIFLYRDDGKLLRQLTRDNSGQMTDPVFAPDGGTIVFTKETKTGYEYWSVEPKGGNLHKLEAQPQWYAATKSSPCFTNQDVVPSADSSPSPSPVATPWVATGKALVPKGPDHCTTPDGNYEIILKVAESDQDDSYDSPGHGKHYQLKDVKAGTTIEMGKLPGFLGLFDLLYLNDNTNARFLISPPLQAAFFGLHLGSTDGETDFALDLPGQKLVQLSRNWAAPVPLPGEPAFLTLTYVRYVPIPGSEKTVNCCYLEHWDAAFNKIRYAEPGTAAICYGASMYRPGKTPKTITIRSEDSR